MVDLLQEGAVEAPRPSPERGEGGLAHRLEAQDDKVRNRFCTESLECSVY